MRPLPQGLASASRTSKVSSRRAVVVRAEGQQPPASPPPAEPKAAPKETSVAKVDRSKDFLYVGSDAAALKYLDGTLPGDFGEHKDVRNPPLHSHSVRIRK